MEIDKQINLQKLHVEEVKNKIDVNVEHVCNQIGKWQKWLSLVSSEIAQREENVTIESIENNGTNTPSSAEIGVAPGELTIAHPVHYFEAILPKWFWSPPDGEKWKADFPNDLSLKSYASITRDDWLNVLAFFQSIEWVVHDSYKTAFIELAYMSKDNGFSFQHGDNPADCATLLRKALNQAMRYHEQYVLIPGNICSKAKSNGKTFPAGYIQGAYPNIQVVSLKKLAINFHLGRSQCLKDWKVSF